MYDNLQIITWVRNVKNCVIIIGSRAVIMLGSLDLKYKNTKGSLSIPQSF